MFDDTIAAPATPPGIGALAIVRLSGPGSIEIAQKIFRPELKRDCIKGGSLYYGTVVDDNRIIDQVMMAIMLSPKSYTGEDMVEITCHGGLLVISEIVDLCMRLGARNAEPGEFTRRAFLNGKMDLSQAESVNMLITARSERARAEALKLMKGHVREDVEYIRDVLINIKSELDADIEWGETEDLNTEKNGTIIDRVRQAEEKILSMINDSADSRQFMEGFSIVICGKPNAGKSSLFNALLKLSRSITSSVPGTTRDVISEEAVLDGFLVKFIDTAGLGLESENELDRVSAFKSMEYIEKADILIYVFDGEKGLEEKDQPIVDKVRDRVWIPVLNKIDSLKEGAADEAAQVAGSRIPVPVSCINSEGIDELKKRVKEILTEMETDRYMINSRQREALGDAAASLGEARKILASGGYEEAASYDISRAVEKIGLVDGKTIDPDILDRIFSRFCIGK